MAAVTAASLLVGANAVTAGLAYLIAVLALAVWRGFVAGAIASLLGVAGLSFFFFPPVPDIRVAERDNWVALVCFLIATAVASRLVARERRRATEAEDRRREIKALYELGVDLFTAAATPGGLGAATSRALRAIGVESGGLALAGADAGTPAAGSWIGAAPDVEVLRVLTREPVAGGEPSGAAGRWRNLRIPVAVGDHPIGELFAFGTRADRATLESVARLVGLAVERERLFAEQARLEALKQSEALKTALLRAVSHDLSTPLTAMGILLGSLRRTVPPESEGARTVELMGEETARLHRRIENLLAMAHLEAGVSAPHREPTPPADAFRAAREHLRLLASARPLIVHVEPDCPDLDVDPSLLLEILVNLIENAHRFSPPGGTIELSAERHPDDPARIRLEVLDRGRGLPAVAEPAPEAPARTAVGRADGERRGLGLEIARSFATALGGRLTLLGRDGGGIRARIDLPAAVLAGQGAGAA
jgi:two-component system sensor histidine kinase KdpD